MVDEKSWEEFRATGLFWWINSILHTFGWAIVLKMEDGKIIGCYPARVKFRGFDEKTATNGYIKVSQYMKDNAEQLLKEAQD